MEPLRRMMRPSATRATRSRDADDQTDTIRIRGRAELMAQMVPTEYEQRSCAGMGPRLRAMEIQEARKDPKVALGDELSSAAYANSVELVKSLLDKGADPNHIHFTVCADVPLARTKSAEVAKLLIAHPKIDVNVRDINDYSILSNMVLHNRDNVDLVSTILWHKDLDVHASNPICTAARFASLDMMRTLLKHPQLDVNDSSGLLHCAMKRTDSISVDLAAWLLEQETLDINLRRSDGTTALMHLSGTDSLTIEIGESEVVKRQQIAARQVQMLKMLLKRSDLEVAAVDSKGSSALHHFSRAGRNDLVEVLLQDPRCFPIIGHQDAEGRTALDVVTEEKNLVRKPWDPSPKLAKYDEVIALLTKAAEKA